MAILKAYNPKVEVLWSTPNPCHIVCTAARNSMKGIRATGEITYSEQLPKYLFEANHGTPLEHAVISFEITQISRAAFDQLRTHRIGTFTSSSQHYQNHSDYECYVAKEMLETAEHALDTAFKEYNGRIQDGMPTYEARQLLPMAVEVRTIWTVNARSLINFINQRVCRRNVAEMILLAHRVHLRAIEWFPELFNHVNCDCMQQASQWKCKQGRMKCNMNEVNETLKKYGWMVNETI